MESETLKPCPFCGGAADLDDTVDESIVRFRSVYCCRCKVTTKDYECESNAIAAWNRRPREEELETELEQVCIEKCELEEEL